MPNETVEFALAEAEHCRRVANALDVRDRAHQFYLDEQARWLHTACKLENDEMAKRIDNGRKSGGFSIREALAKQGVTTEEGMRGHLAFIAETLKINPRLDITRYRVDENYPNGVHLHTGTVPLAEMG